MKIAGFTVGAIIGFLTIHIFVYLALIASLIYNFVK